MNGSAITYPKRATRPLNLPPSYQQSLILRVSEGRDNHWSGISERMFPQMSQVFFRPHPPPCLLDFSSLHISFRSYIMGYPSSPLLQPRTSGHLPRHGHGLPFAPGPYHHHMCKYLLSVYSVPGTILGTRDTVVNIIDMVPTSWSFHSNEGKWGKQTSKYIAF